MDGDDQVVVVSGVTVWCPVAGSVTKNWLYDWIVWIIEAGDQGLRYRAISILAANVKTFVAFQFFVKGKLYRIVCQ